jgi:RNA polymerase sigma factor (sigma-70 family)
MRTARSEPLGLTLDLEADGSSESSQAGWLLPAIGLLPDRQRLVVFLRYYADLDYRSIAEILGVARGTLAATLHAAQEQLRTTFLLEGVRE